MQLLVVGNRHHHSAGSSQWDLIHKDLQGLDESEAWVGLIPVSDSQTAPSTLKTSLWNLCVRKLPIIPSNEGGIKGLMICKWGGLLYVSHVSEERESQGFKRGQIDHILSHSALLSAVTTHACTISARRESEQQDEREQAVWHGWVGWSVPDSGQMAPLSGEGDDIKADSPASLPHLLCVKAFERDSGRPQSFTGFLHQSGFPHTCRQNNKHSQMPWRNASHPPYMPEFPNDVIFCSEMGLVIKYL